MNNVVAVIVTYNRLELLKECVFALQSQKGASCDIMIVNNASSDGTDAYLKELNNIIVYNLPENIGGAGGFNYGMRKAVELGYQYIWIMDDDTIVKPDTLFELLDADKIIGGAEEYGYLSSVVLWKDGTECKMNRPKIKKSFYERIELLEKSLVMIEQATFVSLFVPALNVKKYGLPIKEYFIWGDDIEYTRRIAVRNNKKSYLVGKSQVIHKMNNNEGSSISKDDIQRINRYNYAYRNDNRTYRFEGIKGFLYYTGKCGINVLRVIKNAKNHRIKRIFIIIKNYFSGLFFNPTIEKL